MIGPDDIRRKALNFYPDYLRAWLEGEAGFFPRRVPANLNPDPADMTGTAAAVRRLRDGSKEVQGNGYTLDWQEVNSRDFGRNSFPKRVSFATAADYLGFIGRGAEFAAFTRVADRLRAEVPALEPWLRANATRLAGLAADLDGLIGVAQFLQAHPRPRLFARELPIPAGTKLVETEQALLREWLDLLLPPHAIRADETRFERRYGLRYAETYFHVRLLDEALAPELGFPCREFALPLDALSGLRVQSVEVYVVENKVNLWTLPPLRRGLGLGGLGHSVTRLRDCQWLAPLSITYWGDLDVDGFEILSALRSVFPQTGSVFMDDAALELWRHIAVHGNGRQADPPLHLTTAERTAYLRCRTENLRVEQERIPQASVLEVLWERQTLLAAKLDPTGTWREHIAE